MVQVWSPCPVPHFCSKAEPQPLHDTGEVVSSFLPMRLMEGGLPWQEERVLCHKATE